MSAIAEEEREGRGLPMYSTLLLLNLHASYCVEQTKDTEGCCLLDNIVLAQSSQINFCLSFVETPQSILMLSLLQN